MILRRLILLFAFLPAWLITPIAWPIYWVIAGRNWPDLLLEMEDRLLCRRRGGGWDGRIRPPKPWPAPPPPSVPPLGCMDCRKPYSDFALDATLPDDQWRLIHPGKHGLLCANCMVARAAKLPGAVAVRMRIDIQ